MTKDIKIFWKQVSRKSLQRALGGVFILALTLAFAVLSPAMAASSSLNTLTGLKQVQIGATGQIDLVFDGKVDRKQVRTEFFNDIIQLSLNDVSVYPAKISNVSVGGIKKVFAYQYAPRLVRCRFTVKGKAENFKDQLQINYHGKQLSVRVAGDKKLISGVSVDSLKDRLTLRTAQAMTAPENRVIESQRQEIDPKKAAETPEQLQLLEKVIQASSRSSTQPPSENIALKAETKSAAKPNVKNKEFTASPDAISEPLASGKPLPSPFRVFGKFGILMALFFAGVFAFKKYGKSNQWMNKLSVAKFGRKNKMIEVVSNHYLGPKKSISVVRVGERVLVLGVTNDNINLITQLAPGNSFGITSESSLESAMNMDIEELTGIGNRVNALGSEAGKRSSSKTDSVAGPAAFSDFLGALSSKPLTNTPIQHSVLESTVVTSSIPTADHGSGIRARIKNRLEGLKPL